jgi:transcriptional regulator with XRE-family HTH domain
MQEEICTKFAGVQPEQLPWRSVLGKLAANIKRLRKAKALTQLEVARGIGIQTATQISLWENGKQKVSHENVQKLATFFSITVGGLDPESEAWDAESPRTGRHVEQQSHIPPELPHVAAPPQPSIGVAMGPGDQALFDQIVGVWMLCRDDEERRAFVKHARAFVEHPERSVKKAIR